MIVAVVGFVLVASLIVLQGRARRIRCAVEAGTFAGLASEIELLCSKPIHDTVASNAAATEPLRLAA